MGERRQAVESRFLNWNIGGVAKLKIRSFLESLSQKDDPGLLSFQECPRAKQGWAKTEDMGNFHVISYQPARAWRGLALAFCKRRWKPLAKRATEHTIWLRLLDARTGIKLWVASVYLGTGIDTHERCTQIQTSLEAWPGSQEHVVVGADINVKLQWMQDGDESVPGGTSTKLHNVLSNFAAKNLDLVPQSDCRACTHWTRKTPSAGSQIDVVATNMRARCSEVQVVIGSRDIIGTDHEQLISRILVRRGVVKKKRCGGPRVMCAELQAVPDLDQHTLEQLSANFTKPAPSLKFVPSDAVRVLGSVARRSKRADDWIRYMRELREERVRWRHGKMDEAAKDWRAFRWAKKCRAKSWQPGFGAKQADDPLSAIETHFRKVFATHDSGDVDSQLGELSASVVGDSNGLTTHKVEKAVRAGRRGKAVGDDLAPQELLIAIVECPGGLEKLTKFFNDVLHRGTVPTEWNTSILALLPKTAQPVNRRQS